MAKTGLGKGLSALITEETKAGVGQGYIPALPIEQIVANPYQPRVEMNPEKLVELADSIREHGVIEPLIVTKKGESKYELIAGERR
ncbi:ParB N-terminal domain-containing protein, partial [Candidatus Dojkabacteria bacterium]|nr:ParB N-terminal domain-containing protein [Candidatus Dojkabacteria bacterium]